MSNVESPLPLSGELAEYDIFWRRLFARPTIGAPTGLLYRAIHSCLTLAGTAEYAQQQRHREMQAEHRPTDYGQPLDRRLLWLIAALLIAIGLVDWWYERHKEQRYDPHIVSATGRYAVAPALVKAVIWRESRFNPKVRGRVGELGLMQIRPIVAEEWARAQMHRGFEGNLFEPRMNIEVGAWYLAKLLKRYSQTDNPAAYALADYNAGRSNVLRWNKGPAETNSAAFLAQVTFPATQQYVRAILKRSARYEGPFEKASARPHTS